jgi:putative lipase involved disintegration of autophagic bodies
MITKYETKKDKWRMQLINRRIKDENEKIDIESVLAEIDTEEDEAIDFDDDLDDEVLVEEGEEELEEVLDEEEDE